MSDIPLLQEQDQNRELREPVARFSDLTILS
jgi:hypothetical protein